MLRQFLALAANKSTTLGWIYIRDEVTRYPSRLQKLKALDAEWPPKYCKFQFDTKSNPPVQLAFTDPRRLSRVRLVDCPGPDIREHSPLVENGPDPVVDYPHVFTLEYLTSKVTSKRVPIKTLLLDQAVISGIGNWVGDEVLFQAKIHPEQYSHELDHVQIKALFGAIRNVCQTAVDLIGDATQFPEDWLFYHRWSKGKSDSALPNGEKLDFVTVGGRTSCFSPSRQKKRPGSGASNKAIKRKSVESDADDFSEDVKPTAGKKRRTAKSKRVAAQNEHANGDAYGAKEVNGEGEAETNEKEIPAKKGGKRREKATTKGEPNPNPNPKSTVAQKVKQEATGRRRSARLAA